MKLQTSQTSFFGFTSTAGGAGTSSAAIVFSRIAASLWNKKILFLSFDGISSKMAPVQNAEVYAKGIFVNIRGGCLAAEELRKSVSKDEFGVAYITDAGYFNPLFSLNTEDIYFCMDQIACTGEYDAVVLDFPFDRLRSVELASLCEKIVFCCGRSVSGKADADAFFRNFESFTSDMPEKPQILYFFPEEDPESFSEGVVDIHGQFGAEVRSLASELLEI